MKEEGRKEREKARDAGLPASVGVTAAPAPLLLPSSSAAYTRTPWLPLSRMHADQPVCLPIPPSTGSLASLGQDGEERRTLGCQGRVGPRSSVQHLCLWLLLLHLFYHRLVALQFQWQRRLRRVSRLSSALAGHSEHLVVPSQLSAHQCKVSAK